MSPASAVLSGLSAGGGTRWAVLVLIVVVSISGVRSAVWAGDALRLEEAASTDLRPVRHDIAGVAAKQSDLRAPAIARDKDPATAATPVLPLISVEARGDAGRPSAASATWRAIPRDAQPRAPPLGFLPV